MTRRRFLGALSAIGASVPLAGLLAACGGDDDDAAPTNTANGGGSAGPTSTEAEEPTASTEPEATAAEESEAAATEESDAAPTTESEPTPTGNASVDTPEVDLGAVKAFALDQAEMMKAGTEQLAALAGRYYAVASGAGFDYEAALEQNPQEMPELIFAARDAWITASTHYELDEGIVAGVPSLADFDVWIDAGPSSDEDPVEARDWKLELPNGELMDRPGNFFHSLLEPAIWGTNDAFVGATLDLDGDGEVGAVDVLPEANIFVAAAEGLDGATAEMIDAIAAWEPTLSDVFTAEVTMIPTMNEYFEQWKNSVYVAGSEESDENAFVGLSRLFDINGILSGLNTAYQELSPAVAGVDAELDSQIQSGFDELVSFVADLFEQEQEGVEFSPEEADLYGTEAQDQATALAGQVAQVAAAAEC
ncbi:MAG: imelysin family protein [Thermomicrobiales bacterium]